MPMFEVVAVGTGPATKTLPVVAIAVAPTLTQLGVRTMLPPGEPPALEIATAIAVPKFSSETSSSRR